MHHYEISRERAISFAGFLSGRSRKSLKATTKGGLRRRAEAIPYGAVVLHRLLKVGGLKSVVISACGVREGVLASALSAEERRKDPLLVACAEMAKRLGRDTALAASLDSWIAPLFAAEPTSSARLRLAAAHLSDTDWRVNHAHRSESAFADVMNAPFVGIDHQGRALLALAAYRRYGGDDDSAVKPVERFAGEALSEQATKLGLALRAGLALAGGLQTEILATSTLRLTPLSLILRLPKSRMALIGEQPLEELADAFRRTMRIELR